MLPKATQTQTPANRHVSKSLRGTAGWSSSRTSQSSSQRDPLRPLQFLWRARACRTSLHLRHILKRRNKHLRRRRATRLDPKPIRHQERLQSPLPQPSQGSLVLSRTLVSASSRVFSFVSLGCWGKLGSRNVCSCLLSGLRVAQYTTYPACGMDLQVVSLSGHLQVDVLLRCTTWKTNPAKGADISVRPRLRMQRCTGGQCAPVFSLCSIGFGVRENRRCCYTCFCFAAIPACGSCQRNMMRGMGSCRRSEFCEDSRYRYSEVAVTESSAGRFSSAIEAGGSARTGCGHRFDGKSICCP